MKNTKGDDFAEYVRTLTASERLFLLGQLAMAESIARVNTADVTAHYESTQGLPDIVRSHVMATFYSARRAEERVTEKYKLVALTLSR